MAEKIFYKRKEPWLALALVATILLVLTIININVVPCPQNSGSGVCFEPDSLFVASVLAGVLLLVGVCGYFADVEKYKVVGKKYKEVTETVKETRPKKEWVPVEEEK